MSETGTSAASPAEATPRLEMRRISKTFAGVRALVDARLTAFAGEVHAVMGENGAGKSTLIKILAGAYAADPGGEILIDGAPATIDSPASALERGIAVIYQDFTVRCRMRRLGRQSLSLDEFRRRLAVARAGASEEMTASAVWQEAVEASAALPEDLHGLFLFIARTAIERAPCPSDAELAAVYGSHSPSRARRLLAYIEERGLLVCHVDFRGQRTLALPTLGLETAPGAGAPRTAGMPRGARA